MQNLPTAPDELVDENFVAKYYKQSPRTIKLWRYQGRGPTYMRLSATQIRYRWGDVLEHNAKLSATSTSEETARLTERANRKNTSDNNSESFRHSRTNSHDNYPQ